MKTARNRKTGERLVLDGGEWRKAVEGPLPPWHPRVVPGQAYERWFKQHVTGAGIKTFLDEMKTPDPRYVDPPKFKD